MLLFKTYLTRSPIHGIGVFASRRIHKGDAVWAYHKAIDRRIHISEFAELPPFLRERIMQLSYVNPKHPDYWVLCGDDGRFINFALEGTEPNCGLDPKLTVNGEITLVATRNIDVGEELTVGQESDADAERKLSESVMCVPGIF